MSDLKYLSLVDGMLSDQGALVSVGGRHNAHQQEYASYVAKALVSKESTALLEANTGIGKSIGYLLPSLVYLSLNPKSNTIAVSTHTRALQKQLMEKDIPLVVAAMKHANMRIPSIAFRMGRQAFFSPTRLNDLLSSMPQEEVTSEHKALLVFAQKSALSGTGLWMDYIEEFGVFPKGVCADDICLLHLMQPDNPAYDRHLLEAKSARLLVTNHATILSHNIFSDVTFHALISDEAHEIEEVCKNLSTHKSQLKRIISAIQATQPSKKALNKVAKVADGIASRLEVFDAENGSTNNLISDISHNNLLDEIQPAVLSLKKHMQDIRASYLDELDDSLTNKQAVNVDRIDNHLKTLSAFESGTHLNRRRAVGFSNDRREPSIASVSLSPGRLFHYKTMELTHRRILTSATIANASTKSLSFTQICGALGLPYDGITGSCSISPSNFGQMKFVTVPRGKSPVFEFSEDEVVFNKSWIEATTKMIDMAASTGKTLVLSPSIKESKLFADRISSSYILQDTNNPLMQITDNYIKGDESVLLSAGAWNGISLRKTDGSQLIENIVITRIPFMPVDEALEFLNREYMLSKGLTESKIRSIQWTNKQYLASIKLKQGIGRGLRAPTDRVKIWFADPRMPTQTHSSGLISAIPHRFLSNYFDAQIFEMNEVVESEPILYL